MAQDKPRIKPSLLSRITNADLNPFVKGEQSISGFARRVPIANQAFGNRVNKLLATPVPKAVSAPIEKIAPIAALPSKVPFLGTVLNPQAAGSRLANEAIAVSKMGEDVARKREQGGGNTVLDYGLLGLGALGSMSPGLDDIGFGGYEYIKSRQSGLSDEEAKKRFVGNPEEGAGFTGLGDALVGEDNEGSQFGNLIELPAIIAFGGVAAKKSALDQMPDRVASVATKGKKTAKIADNVTDTAGEQRSLFGTLLKSDDISPSSKAKIAQHQNDPVQYYRQISNEETLGKAREYIDEVGLDAAATQLKSQPTFENSVDVMTGIEAMRRYAKEGKFDLEYELAENLAEKATEAGRTVQAFATLNKLSPQAQVKRFQKYVQDSNRQMREFDNSTFGKAARIATGRTQEAIPMPPDELKKQVFELASRARQVDDIQIENGIRREIDKIMSDYVPLSRSERLTRFWYNNMLSSPQTILRNASGVIQTFITRPMDLASMATIDMFAAPLQGRARKVYFSDVIDHERRVMSEWKKGSEIFMAYLGTSDEKLAAMGDHPDLWGQRLMKSTNQTLGGPQWTFFSRVLEGTDKMFTHMITEAEYARLVKSGVSEIDARTQAMEIAEEYLFRRRPGYGGEGIISDRIDEMTKWVSDGTKKNPLVKAFIPFVNIAGNITKQGVEYMPGIGTINALTATKKGEKFSKQLTGSAMMLIGSSLAHDGRLTWAAPLDPKERELFYAQGKKPFSIRIGDVYMPLQFLGPLAIPLLYPAAVNYYANEAPDAMDTNWIEANGKAVLNTYTQLIANQSYLEQVENLMQLIIQDPDASVAGSLAFSAKSAVPFSGLVRWISQMVDPVYRKNKTLKDALVRDLPFISREAEAYTNPFGEESRRPRAGLLLPYTPGIADDRFNAPAEARQRKLRLNAQEKKLKKEAEKFLSDSELKSMEESLPASSIQDENLRAMAVYMNLDKVIDMPESTAVEKAEKRSAAFSKVDNILENQEIPQEIKPQLIQALGITEQEADYYMVAKQNNDIKLQYVVEQATQLGEDRNTFINSLVRMRQEVNGKKIAANGVIDDLYEMGLLTSNERKMLKELETDPFTGKIKAKSSSRGGRKAKLDTTVPRASVPGFSGGQTSRRIQIKNPTRGANARIREELLRPQQLANVDLTIRQ